MFDYSIDKDEKKSFILNYEIVGENIKVNCASGGDYYVPNTKENEQHLIKKMEEQVSDSWGFKNKQEKRKKSAIGWLIYDACFLVFNTIMMFINPTVLTGVCIGLFLVAGYAQIPILKDVKTTLKDLEKNKLFLENKKAINSFLDKGNLDVLEDTMVPTLDKQEDIITINDVHDMGYDEVDKIVTDIRRDQELGINRPKVLVKNYLPNKNKK